MEQTRDSEGSGPPTINGCHTSKAVNNSKTHEAPSARNEEEIPCSGQNNQQHPEDNAVMGSHTSKTVTNRNIHKTPNGNNEKEIPSSVTLSDCEEHLEELVAQIYKVDLENQLCSQEKIDSALERHKNKMVNIARYI